MLPLAVAATTVFGESIPHRPRTRRNFDFGDFASSDASYEAFEQPYVDTDGYAPHHDHDPPSLKPYDEPNGYSPSTRDSKSQFKGDSGGTVNEFDNLTPYYDPGEVAVSSDDSLDPEGRFFIDMCAVKNFFGRKKRSAAPLFFFHYGYNRCHKGYGKGHSKGYGHGHHRKRRR